MLSLLIALAAVAEDSPVPAMQDVIALDAASTCPDVPDGAVPGLVRTSVGMMLHQGDGTYRYLCPSRWGGAAATHGAVAPDQASHVVLAGGGVWRSVDGMCSASELPLPEGLVGVQLLYWRSAYYVLAHQADVAGQDVVGASLLKLDGDTFTELVTWDDFEPDGLAPAGSDVLWLAGALPEPQVRRLTFTGGLRGDVALPELPPDRVSLESLVPMAAEGDEAWLVARRGTTDATWHARVIEGTSNTVVAFTDVVPHGRSVLGPVRMGKRWLAVIDNTLHVTPAGTAGWTSTGVQSPWTCLTQVGEKVLACTVDDVLLVEAVGEQGKARTAPVFSFDQVVAPGDTCSTAACDDDWARVGGALGLLEREEPAVCPDGRTLSDLDPQGCACSSGPGALGALPWVGVLGLGALGRRRRDPHRG